jgi:hypothetical protein
MVVPEAEEANEVDEADEEAAAAADGSGSKVEAKVGEGSAVLLMLSVG